MLIACVRHALHNLVSNVPIDTDLDCCAVDLRCMAWGRNASAWAEKAVKLAARWSHAYQIRRAACGVRIGSSSDEKCCEVKHDALQVKIAQVAKRTS